VSKSFRDRHDYKLQANTASQFVPLSLSLGEGSQVMTMVVKGSETIQKGACNRK
jgi:hypothetical protein